MDSHLEKIQVILNHLNKKVLDLEKDSHPPIILEEFEGFKEIVERIEKLVKNLNNSGSG